MREHNACNDSHNGDTIKEALFLLYAQIFSFASDGGKLIYLGIGSQLLDTKKEFSFLIKRHM